MIELSIDSFLQGKGVRNLSGHERGVAARDFFDLDELDTAEDEIVIVVPPSIDAIASSFFQGMFANSVREFESDEEFLEHYRFKASPSVFRQIEQGIRRIRTKRRSAFAR